MKYFISFSGGLSSAVTALACHERGVDFDLIFADTLIEDEDLYRFNKDIAKAVGKEIIHLTDGRTPWDVFIDKRWIGNSRTAHCSNTLKTDQVRAYLAEHAQPDDALVLGFDWSEADRLERAQARWDRPVVSLLMDWKIYRPDYQAYLDRYGIEQPRLYKYGFLHNNCGGFCVKAGQVQFKMLLDAFPERYEWHEDQMIIATDAIGETAKPFLRVTIDGELKYLNLTEFREFIQAGNQIDMFSESGCGCFLD